MGTSAILLGYVLSLYLLTWDMDLLSQEHGSMRHGSAFAAFKYVKGAGCVDGDLIARSEQNRASN